MGGKEEQRDESVMREGEKGGTRKGSEWELGATVRRCLRTEDEGGG